MGNKTVCRLQENMSAAYVDLSEDDVKRLTAIADDTLVSEGTMPLPWHK